MTTAARRTTEKRFGLSLLVGLVAVGLLGLPALSAAQGQGPVKIGYIYTDTGPLAQLGQDMRDGFLLYWSEVGNRAGGRPVEILLESTGAFHNPIHTVYMFKTERKGGVLQNVPIASYPDTSQFWTWTPEAFMALPSGPEMRNKWVK